MEVYVLCDNNWDVYGVYDTRPRAWDAANKYYEDQGVLDDDLPDALADWDVSEHLMKIGD